MVGISTFAPYNLGSFTFNGDFNDYAEFISNLLVE
jgi:hypothetical protein